MIEKTLSSINSYFGLLKHFDSWRVKLKGWNMLDERIRKIFRTNENLNKIWLDPKVKRQVIDDARKMFTRPMIPAKKYRESLRDKECARPGTAGTK